MEKDTFQTDVIFRKEKDNTIIAVFPYNLSDYEGNMTCYAHIGQHHSVCYGYCLEKTVPALESEYTDLKTELESIGYNLRIIKKKNRQKYLDEYYKIRTI